MARIEDYAINGILNELYVGVLLYVYRYRFNSVKYWKELEEVGDYVLSRQGNSNQIFDGR